MKTKISLSIIGIFNITMSLLMAFTIKDMIPLMLNTEVKEAIRMVEVMHYGLFPAVLMISLICVLCRNVSLEIAKNTSFLHNWNNYFNVYVFYSFCK